MVVTPPHTVKPFVELLNRPDGRFARVGYRPVGFEHDLVSVELPIQILEQAITRGLDLTTRITPSGDVVSHIRGWSETELINLRLVTSIDILISQAVNPDNLRLEEASLAELNELRRSLELGIEQVKAALRRAGVEV